MVLRLQVSLRVLGDEYTAFRKWWTSRNQGITLTRYLGGKLKFYRRKKKNNIKIVKNCTPLDVTTDNNLNQKPNRTIMNK